MQENLMRWLASGERGESSNTMVTHLTGIMAHRRGRGFNTEPADTDDLNRCRKLLEEVPELKPLLPNMATCSGAWAQLVAHWQQLCDLMDAEAPRWREGQGSAPKTYRRMRELIEAGRG